MAEARDAHRVEEAGAQAVVASGGHAHAGPLAAAARQAGGSGSDAWRHGREQRRLHLQAALNLPREGPALASRRERFLGVRLTAEPEPAWARQRTCRAPSPSCARRWRRRQQQRRARSRRAPSRPRRQAPTCHRGSRSKGRWHPRPRSTPSRCSPPASKRPVHGLAIQKRVRGRKGEAGMGRGRMDG